MTNNIPDTDRENSTVTEALRIADGLMKRASNSTGLLPSWIDSKDGRVLSKRSNVDELGDYVQNVAYLTQLTGKSKYISWALEHTKSCIRFCQTSHGLFQNLPDVNLPNKPILSPVWSLENVDTVTGLVSLYEFTRDQEILGSLRTLIAGVDRGFIKKGLICFGRIPIVGIRIPLAAGVVCGQFAEEAIHLGQITGDPAFKQFGENILDRYQSSSYFQTHGVFPTREFLSNFRLSLHLIDFLYRFRKKPALDTACLVKDNLYILLADLELYRSDPKEEIKSRIVHFIQSIDDIFLGKNSCLYNNLWSPKEGAMGPQKLQHNHSIIELYLDLFHTFGDQNYLKRAGQLAQYWMDQQTKIGLFPEFPERTELEEALLDPQVDMVVNLIKLFELTENRSYMDSARKCVQGVIQHFRLDHGYAWKVDSNTGTPIQTRIETKFLGLLIKGLIAMEVALRGDKIFENPLLWSICRDR